MQDNIVFVRVDDRLIHGQIVNSWLNVYRNIRHIIVLMIFQVKIPMQRCFNY